MKGLVRFSAAAAMAALARAADVVFVTDFEIYTMLVLNNSKYLYLISSGGDDHVAN